MGKIISEEIKNAEKVTVIDDRVRADEAEALCR